MPFVLMIPGEKRQEPFLRTLPEPQNYLPWLNASQPK
jgi:hypothetical protein